MENKREITVRQAGEAIADVRRAMANLAVVARHNAEAGDDVVESHELVELCKPYARTILEAAEGLGEILKADPKPFSAILGDFHNQTNIQTWGIA